jgi:hypothetical protein
MKLVEHKNKKLLYAKYLYKVNFNFNISYIFRSYFQKNDLDYALKKINQFEKMLQDSKKSQIHIGNYQKISINENHIKDARNLRNCLNSLSSYIIRNGNANQLCIFFNEPNLLFPVLKNLATVSELKIWNPDPSIEKNAEPDILVSKHASQYSHKVTIKMGRARRKNSPMIGWIENNRDKIKISSHSLKNATTFVSMYVRDEKVLMLLKMTDNDVIDKTERLVLPS